MLDLAYSDYRLTIDPERGGSIARFSWCDNPMMRSTCGQSILDTACFPLVPFSNRIGGGRFASGGRNVCLPANFPSADPHNALHGFGWLAAWQVCEANSSSALLVHHYPGGDWPWPYRCEQHMRLDEQGLEMTLILRNLGDRAMPAGLGFHPYFPTARDATYHALHRGEWRNAADGLPKKLDERSHAYDWWQGRPVTSRTVDTVYTRREGNLEITWPSRNLSLLIVPSPNLPFTVVYTPANADYFCIEPVSHETDAFNRTEQGARFAVIEPDAEFAVSMRLSARKRSIAGA